MQTLGYQINGGGVLTSGGDIKIKLVGEVGVEISARGGGGIEIGNFNEIKTNGLHLFFNKQSIFDPRPEKCSSFSKKSFLKIV